MITKLKSTAGETITEVLVASLVAVMGVLLYATMVMSSFNIINRAEERMKSFYEAESQLAEQNGEKVLAKVSIEGGSFTGISEKDQVVDVDLYQVENGGDIKVYVKE